MKTLNKIFAVVAVSALALSVVSCASTARQESTGQYVDSSAITVRVKSALLADRSVKSLPISVKTYKNVVQLSGFVDNRYQENRAVEIARSVPGVADVQDSLILRSGIHHHHHHHHHVVKSVAPAAPAPVASNAAEPAAANAPAADTTAPATQE